jgi:hypothetical protein
MNPLKALLHSRDKPKNRVGGGMETQNTTLGITYDRDMNGSVGVKEDACHTKTVAMGR